MRNLVLFFWVISVCAIGRSVAGQCVSYHYATNNAGSIGVRTGSGWSQAPPISSAIGLWDSGCAGMAGSDFPSLLADSDGAITVYVSRMQGRIPQGAAGCARFNHSLDAQNRVIGGTIEVYEQDSAGNDCLWVMPAATLDNLIAHELGHVLGLANTMCSNHIMGPDWPYVGPHADECDWLDYGWSVPNEPSDGGGCTGSECGPFDEESPILIRLRDGPYRLTGLDDPVMFDIDADGELDVLGWTARGAELAFLALDRNGNGRIDDGAELFGTATLLGAGVPAPNGFEALKELDDHADEVIDAQDSVWSSLLLWVDRDHNGMSSATELMRIGHAGLISIDLAYRWSGRRDEHGNSLRYQSEVLIEESGRRKSRKIHDIFFVTH